MGFVFDPEDFGARRRKVFGRIRIDRPRPSGTHRKWVWGMPERRRSTSAQFLKLTIFKTLPPARNPENVAEGGVESIFGANFVYPVQHIFIRLVHRVYRVSRHVRRALADFGVQRGVVQGIRKALLNMVSRLHPPADLIWTDTDT